MTDHITISDFADRTALSRMIELKFAISDLVNSYIDLPPGVIAHTLSSAASDLVAVAHLPPKPPEPAP